MSHLVETLVGAGLTSVAGAVAVRWGFHPDLVAGAAGLVGAVNAFSDKERSRYLGLGATSAAGSQFVLRTIAPKRAPQIAVHVPAPAPTPRVKNADLGALPSGMLEAAFERARTELAVAGDGYPANYDHPHHG